MVTLTIDAHNMVAIMCTGNQTYLLIDGESALLIDAGTGLPAHLADLAAALDRAGARLEQVIVTHAHSDHAGGAPALAEAYPDVRFRKLPWPEEDARFAVTWEPLTGDAELRVGGETLQVLHTPGHAPDHVALWHQASGVMWTGDLILPGGNVMIPHSRQGNLRDYLASLERVRQLRPTRVLPAHGSEVAEPDRAIRRHIEHRQAREAQVVAALAAGRRTVPEITESIYHGLAPALLKAAQENVRAHLEKLTEEHRAVAIESGWIPAPAQGGTGATIP